MARIGPSCSSSKDPSDSSNMSKPSSYLLLSLPSSVTPSGHKDDALGHIQSTVGSAQDKVVSLSIPDFKIGTLDACLQQSDELAKLEGLCKGVVSKVSDTLKNVLDGDEDKAATHKSVNDSTAHPMVSPGRLLMAFQNH